MRKYDSEDGIRDYIRTFKGLHDLQKARHEAGYKRNEQLKQWIVLGRYFFDNCGNFGVMKFSEYEGVSSVISKLDDVISADTFYKVFKDLHYSWGISNQFAIPPLEARCDYCNEDWAVANAHDSYYHRSYTSDNEVIKWYHIGCRLLDNELTSMKYFSEITSKAGLTKSPIVLIPNEYYLDQDDPYTSPWALIKTYKGDIKVGWRKRVINIDWKDLYDKKIANTNEKDYEIRWSINGEKLFANEDVTKSEHMIHAWSLEKAVEYITKICEAFEVKTYK